MAINIPIISSLNTAGFDKAKKEFQSLDGAAAKSKFAIQKAAVPAAAAFAGIAVALGSAAKAAVEDQKEQAILAQTLRNTTGASVLQTRAVEEFITQQSRAAAVADSELRPALGNLLRATGDVTKAQELLSYANSSLHPTYGRMFFLAKNNASDSELMKITMESIQKQWDDMEAKLANQPYLAGKECTIGDILVCVIANWSDAIKFGPNTKDFFKRITSRPAYQKALAAENVQYKAAA
jgi:hypothetical protein